MKNAFVYQMNCQMVYNVQNNTNSVKKKLNIFIFLLNASVKQFICINMFFKEV